MCPVVGRIDMPTVAHAMVWLIADAIHHRVPQLHVFVLHIDLRPEDSSAFVRFPVSHLAKELEVLFNRTRPKRAFDAGPPEATPLN